jgi:hypothetical protein
MKSMMTKRPRKAEKSRRMSRASAAFRKGAAAGAIVVTLITASYFVRSCTCEHETVQQRDQDTARF